MVEQSGEPLLLSFPYCFPHTVQPLGHAFPALCRAHARLNDVLPRLCPSLPSLRRRLPSLVRLVHRYYDTVRLLRHVHVRRSVCGLRGPALIVRPRRAGDLRVLVHVVSQRARVLRLRRTEQPLAFSAAAVLPSSTLNGVGILIYGLFAAQWPRPPVPLSTLQETPRDVPSKTRGQDGFATSFPVGLLHPLHHAGLARRTPGCPSSFQEGMIEKRSITLMGRTTSATV